MLTLYQQKRRAIESYKRNFIYHKMDSKQQLVYSLLFNSFLECMRCVILDLCFFNNIL